jgi:serine/threonine protein kinase
VLISSAGCPLLSDFGVSRVIVTSHVDADTTSFRGSIRWMAIEFFTPSNRSASSSFQPLIANKKTDVWAFGMTVYVSILMILFSLTMMSIMQEIITGKRPFEHLSNDVFVMMAIANGELPPAPQGLRTMPIARQKLWELCNKCWLKDPLLRPSMSDLLNLESISESDRIIMYVNFP